MSNKDLLRTPHHPKDRDDFWWYEDKGGIDIVATSDCGCVVQCRINWTSLRAALKRKDKQEKEDAPCGPSY
jgi:hypothetical protein